MLAARSHTFALAAGLVTALGACGTTRAPATAELPPPYVQAIVEDSLPPDLFEDLPRLNLARAAVLSAYRADMTNALQSHACALPEFRRPAPHCDAGTRLQEPPDELVGDCTAVQLAERFVADQGFADSEARSELRFTPEETAWCEASCKSHGCEAAACVEAVMQRRRASVRPRAVSICSARQQSYIVTFERATDGVADEVFAVRMNKCGAHIRVTDPHPNHWDFDDDSYYSNSGQLPDDRSASGDCASTTRERQYNGVSRVGCSAGDPGSCETVVIGSHGIPTSEIVKAITIVMNACAKGDHSMCYSLGVAYERGLGVRKNPAEAVAIYARECQANVFGACESLGDAHIFGRGVKREAAKAVPAYAKACLGDPVVDGSACIKLGVMYAEGRGVPVNLKESQRWFDIACDHSNFEPEERASLCDSVGSHRDAWRFAQ